MIQSFHRKIPHSFKTKDLKKWKMDFNGKKKVCEKGESSKIEISSSTQNVLSVSLVEAQQCPVRGNTKNHPRRGAF